MSVGIHKMRSAIPIRIAGSVVGNVSSANGTTHSLGNIDVGPASGDKNCIMMITSSDGAANSISSLTVGGVSLSLQVNRGTGSGERIKAAIYTGDISSVNGSQAISVTFFTSVESAGVSAVAVSGLRSLTAIVSDGDSNNSGDELTITGLAAPVGGIAVGAAVTESDGATMTWLILTEKADIATGGGGVDHRHTAAWDLGLLTPVDEKINATGGSNRAGVGAGFR